jgi:hypothetical protein
MQRIYRVIGAGLLLAGSAAVQAVLMPIELTDTTRCGAGNAINGIAVGDVTGDLGGADECWGTYDGNDPGPSGGGFKIGDIVYDFIAKENTPGIIEGAHIGLEVLPATGVTAGTWSYDQLLFDPSEFLIVLKAANSPGYATWLFGGASAASFSGDWLVAWGPALSHLAIYAPEGWEPSGGEGVPEPAPLALIGLGGLLLGWMQRKARA